jgi:hypothetical protein
MIYGYNSRLSVQTVHEVPDFSDMFLEELKKARRSREVLLITRNYAGTAC